MEGLFLTWFANAIMAGVDSEARKRDEAVRAALENAAAVMEKCGCLDCCCSGVKASKLIRELKQIRSGEEKANG